MAALNLNMTIPLGNAGHIHLTIDVGDITALNAHQRAIIADTGREFYSFAAKTLMDIPELIAGDAEPSIDELEALLHEPERPPPVIHSTDGDVLRGVTGSRHRDKL